MLPHPPGAGIVMGGDGWLRAFALPLIAGVAVACAGDAPPPSTGATALPSPTAAEDATPPTPTPVTPTPAPDDLDLLAAFYDRTHPEPPSDLRGRIDELRAAVPDPDGDRSLVELMRLTGGRERDGHSGVFPLAQRELSIWPLQLYAFADGWRVVAATAGAEDLVGGAVTAVGGRPVEEVADLVAPLVPADNAASTLGRLPQFLVVPSVLRGLGLEASIEVDGRTVRPEPIDTAAYADWSGSFSPLVCPPLPREGPTWEVEERDGAVVVTYRVVSRSSGSTAITTLVGELQDLVAATDPHAVVLDVRDNPGGENGSYPPLLTALTELAGARPGTLRVLVNRCTFSAATNLVMQVLEGTDAVTIGETMGGAPGMWGDPRESTLPGSGITVHVASRWWELGGRPDLLTLEPDLELPVTWADHAAGRDPALAAARGPGPIGRRS